MPDNREQEQLVTLIEVDTPARADLIRSILQGSGIPSCIPAEAFGMTFSGVFGLKIMVRAKDLERARELLRETDSGNNYNYS